MSTTAITDGHKFQPLATKPVQMISSSMGELSCQDALKKMSKKEEDNHKLSNPKIKKSRVPLMYKHQHIDKQGGAIFIKTAGVSLLIPPGALSKRTFISIEVKSAGNCHVGGLDQSTSLTPVVSCKPDGLNFQKPVELILPHCAEFDDTRLHNATARFVGGDVNVSTDSTNKQDHVRCVLKERYCHVYTTHFSDVDVCISNCSKKRMLVVPFSGGSTKLYVKVWIINDLPSEYTILLHEQKELNFAPFSHTGKFIFENHGQCSLKVQSYLDDEQLTEVSKDIDIQLLFRKVRSVHEFEMERSATDALPKFVTVSFLKEPVFYLKKEIQDGDGFESVQEETCASDEIETQHGEVAQTQTESDDIIQQIFTYQTDIFKAIGEFCTAVSKSVCNIGFQYRQHEHKSEIFTTVTSLQSVIFKKISSFSEDIFWKLSPDERELIKAISSFNTDILERVSTAQTGMFAFLQRGMFAFLQREMFAALQRDAYKTVTSLRTEMFERISTFIEATLQRPPLMQADVLYKVKTLELAIFGRIEALLKDLNKDPHYLLQEFMWSGYNSEFSSGIAPFVTELFQRVSSFYEGFLRLSPMGLEDIATKVTVLVQDLLQDTSAFAKGIAQVLWSASKDRSLPLRLWQHQACFITMINSVQEGLLTDISTFVKGFQDSMPSFGEDLSKQMSSLQNDFLELMSSLEKDLAKQMSSLQNDLSKQISSLQNALLKLMSSLEKDLTKPPSPARIDLPKPPSAASLDLTKPPSPASIDLTKPPSPASTDLSKQMSSLENALLKLMSSLEKELLKPPSPARIDLPKPPSPASIDLPKPPSPASIDLPKPPSPASIDLTKPPSPARIDLTKPPSPARIDLTKPPSPASIDLSKQMSSLENALLKLMSSLKKALLKLMSSLEKDLSKQISSLQNALLKLMSSLEKVRQSTQSFISEHSLSLEDSSEDSDESTPYMMHIIL